MPLHSIDFSLHCPGIEEDVLNRVSTEIKNVLEEFCWDLDENEVTKWQSVYQGAYAQKVPTETVNKVDKIMLVLGAGATSLELAKVFELPKHIAGKIMRSLDSFIEARRAFLGERIYCILKANQPLLTRKQMKVFEQLTMYRRSYAEAAKALGMGTKALKKTRDRIVKRLPCARLCIHVRSGSDIKGDTFPFDIEKINEVSQALEDLIDDRIERALAYNLSTWRSRLKLSPSNKYSEKERLKYCAQIFRMTTDSKARAA